MLTKGWHKLCDSSFQVVGAVTKRQIFGSKVLMKTRFIRNLRIRYCLQDCNCKRLASPAHPILEFQIWRTDFKPVRHVDHSSYTLFQSNRDDHQRVWLDRICKVHKAKCQKYHCKNGDILWWDWRFEWISFCNTPRHIVTETSIDARNAEEDVTKDTDT